MATLLRSPLPPAALALVAGLLVADGDVAACLLAPLLLADARWPEVRATTRALLLGLLLGRAGHGGDLRLPADGVALTVLEGVVARAEPPAGGAARFLLDAETAGEGRERRPWRARVDVDVGGPPDGAPGFGGGTLLLPGNRVRLPVRLRAVPGPRNPGAQDPRRWARVHGVEAWARVEDARAVERVAASTGVPAAIAELRAEASAALGLHLGPEDAGLARALLLGDRGSLTARERERFRAAGQAHLVAVSGQHVALVLAAVLILVRRLGAGTRLASVVGLAAIAIYVPLTGSPPSAVRSGVGASLWLLGRLLAREPSGLPMLAAAALAMLAVAPNDLLDPGFTLSFGAVLGIELLTPRFTALLVPSAPVLPGLLPRKPARLRRLFAVALAAWLGSAGLALFLLGQVSFAAAPLSVPAVPLTAALLAFAALAVVLAPIAPLAAAPAWLFARTADLLRLLLDVPPALGLETITVRPPGPIWLALSGVALLVLGLGPARAFRWAVLAQVLLFAAALAPPEPPRPAYPRVLALDAGRTPAVIVLLPDGRSVLIDAGNRAEYDTGRRVVLPALRALGVTRLDVAVATSPERARLDALADVLAEVPASRRVVEGEPGVLLEGLWGRLEILPASPPLGTSRRTCDRAPVFRLVTAAGRTLLWPTEREDQGIEDLFAYVDPLPPDVLLLPRRGATETLARRLQGPWSQVAVLAPARGAEDDAPAGTLAVADVGAIEVDLRPDGVVLTGHLQRDSGKPTPRDPYDPRAMVSPPSTSVLAWMGDGTLPTSALVWFALGLAVFAALTVRPLRWLRPGGAVAAWALGVLTMYAFEMPGFIALFATFLVATLLGKLPGAKRDRGRTFKQVFSNGFPATVGALWAICGHQGMGSFSFFLGALACLGADTCATEIGVRYGGTPRSLLTGRPLVRGESGGVTFAGLLASVLGGAVPAVAMMAVGGFTTGWGALSFVGIFAAIGLAGSLLDSVLGAALQYRGRDPATGVVSEARRVDGRPTERVSGIRWLDNDAVNLVSGLAAGSLGVAVLFLFLVWS